MKYIRTKDAYGKEIIALFDDRPVEKGGNVLKFSQKSIVLRKGIVIKRKDFDNCKQADNIKELCDAWIIVPIGVNCNPYVRPIYQDISHFINSSHVIFAGIWIQGNDHEPILTPAAMINEEGELKLL